MDWRSNKKLPTKLYRASILALALAYLALDAGEQVALLHAPQRRYRGKAGFAALAYALLHAPATPTPPAAPLPRHSSVLVISDFLNPLPPWKKIFNIWAETWVSRPINANSRPGGSASALERPHLV